MRTTHPSREAMLGADARALVLRLSAPSMLAMLSSSLGGLLDALLLGRTGAQAVAAVSLSFPLTALFQAVGFTLGTGAGSFLSRSLGGGDERAAGRAASSALAAALAVPSALSLLGFWQAEPLLRLLGATDSVLGPGVRYARYALACGPLLCVNLTLSSLLRGEGRAWPYALSYASGALAGAALCYLLVARLGMGISGAGLAMLAREGVTLLLLGAATLKSPLRPSPKLVSASPFVWAEIMRSGLPALLRQGLVSASAALVGRQCAALGEAALAGMGLAMRVLSPLTAAVIGFGQGFQPVCGFAFGAGDLPRVRRAYRFCQAAACAALAAAGAALFAFAPALARVLGADGEAARFGARVLRAQALALPAQGAVILMNMLVQSMGLTLRASLIAASRQGYALIPLALLMPRFFGASGVVLCQTAADLLALPLCWLLTRGTLDAPSAAARTPARRQAPALPRGPGKARMRAAGRGQTAARRSPDAQAADEAPSAGPPGRRDPARRRPTRRFFPAHAD